jgi:hypothetical protein
VGAAAAAATGAASGAAAVSGSNSNQNRHERFGEHSNAIDAAQRSGIRRIFYTSIVQRAGSVFDLTPGHLATEDIWQSPA